MVSSELHENGPHKAHVFELLSPVGGIIWEGLVVVGLLEGVYPLEL